MDYDGPHCIKAKSIPPDLIEPTITYPLYPNMSRLYTHINDPEKPLKIVVNHQPTIIYQFPVKLYYIFIYLMFNPHIGEMSLSSPVVNTWHKLSIQLSSPHPSWWVAQSTGVFQADPRTGPASFRRRGSDLGHFKGSNILGQGCLCI